jgi:hypothetical protein
MNSHMKNSKSGNIQTSLKAKIVMRTLKLTMLKLKTFQRFFYLSLLVKKIAKEQTLLSFWINIVDKRVTSLLLSTLLTKFGLNTIMTIAAP